MLDFNIEYSGRGSKVVGPEKVTTKTVADLLEWAKSNHIALSFDFLEEQQKVNNFPKEDFGKLTDGVLGRSEYQVKDFGKIEYVSNISDIREVILEAMRLVVERSPTRTGYYQSTNVLMLNGKVVARGIFEANAYLKRGIKLKNTDRFRIVNLAPYARKLERLGVKRATGGKAVGTTSGKSRKGKSRKGNLITVPNGAYWAARRVLRGRYPLLKNNIKFSFIPISPSIAKSQNTKRFKPDNYTFATGKGRGRPYLYPSITISINEGAFTKLSQNAGFTEGSGNL